MDLILNLQEVKDFMLFFFKKLFLLPLIINSLLIVIFLHRISFFLLLFFPFNYQYMKINKKKKKKREIDGWNIYDPVKEYKRQGIPNNKWRLTTFNEKYEYSPTYPNIFCVPNSITDAHLIEVCKFRSKGRIPILSWLHPRTGCAIVRSAQPLVGLNTRSSFDEALLKFLSLFSFSFSFFNS